MVEPFLVQNFQLSKVSNPSGDGLVDLGDLDALWKALLEIDSPDLVICGMATVIAEVNPSAAGPQLRIVLDTDFGRVGLPEEAPIGINHYVVDGRFIPLRQEDVVALEQILEGVGVSIGGILDRAKFFTLVYLSGRLEIQLEIPDGVSDSFLEVSCDFEVPELKASLYPYQNDGLRWLINSWELGVGAILADEMGLGKTLQAIGLIAHVFARKPSARVLIIAPSTLIRNWEVEIARFATNLLPYVHNGRDRRLQNSEFRERPLVVTTYDTLRIDFPLFESASWDLVVCDEAQALKNSTTARNNQVASLNARSKVLVTGTPVENSVSDLVSLVDVAVPGMLGFYEREGRFDAQDVRIAKLLGQVCAPVVLRREVKDVARDLPDLIVQDEPLTPSDGFIDLYEEIRLASKDVGILPTITRLQQLCCSPKVLGEGYDLIFDSKLARLHEICREVFEYSSEKVLIFTTFVDSVDLISGFLAGQFGSEQVRSIDGRLKPSERQGLVDVFNSHLEPRFLVINPKAGGAGLNLQGANHVIHFNPQWNPQLERQATARAFRRGQERPVWVRNFFYSGTVEELIRGRLELKLDVASASLEDSVVTTDKDFQEKVMAMSPRSGR